MMKFLKDAPDYFSTSFFVAVSLGAMLVAGVFYLIFPSVLEPSDEWAEASPALALSSAETDPMVTRIPGLADILGGPLTYTGDPAKGPAAAPVTLVIFSDFTCEYCARQEGEINRLLALYPDRVRLIWKDYPEGSLASPSWQAAISARCAAEQDKFWLMHDFLFKTEKIDPSSIKKLASRIGLSAGRFDSCLAGETAKVAIADNIAEANALGINGVPYLFINDKKLTGEADLETLIRAVEAELNNPQK